MNKVTVVIPTLCKSNKVLKHSLEQCQECDRVEEILVFDNTLTNFASTLSKVKVFNEENLYVNPAWNKGLELTKTPYYLLLNDDVIVSKEVIEACGVLLDENKMLGITSVVTTSITESEIDFYMNANAISLEPEFSIRDENDQFYCGWFVFGRTNLWKPIPKDLLYFFGDNWVYYHNFKQKRKVAVLDNYTIYHVTSTTCKATNKYQDGTLQKEEALYLKYLNTPAPTSKKLSLCMIVKNEEEKLERCLQSVKDVVDEIIIVDTGSTDSTKDIARKFTDNIFDFTWNDSFADARNASIEKATGDWILILDADEVLKKGSREDFEKLMNIPTTTPVGYQVHITSVVDSNGDTEEIESYMIRFFPNLPSLRFKGDVHEWLEDSTKTILTPVTQTIRLFHDGYLTRNMEKKSDRNLKLLHSSKVDKGNKIHHNFYLAATYSMSNQIDLALEYFEKWEKEALKSNVDLSLGYTVYLYCMNERKRWKEAIDRVTPHILKCWHNPDFCINLGICYENIGEYDKALKILKRATTFDARNVLSLDVASVQWKPYVIIGNIYLQQGEYETALEYWEKSYDSSQRVEVLQGIIDVSYQLRDMKRLEKYLVEMKTRFKDYKHLNNDVMYANLLFNQGKIEESIKLFLALPNGQEYINTIIQGLISMERFDEVEKVTGYVKQYTLENAS